MLAIGGQRCGVTELGGICGPLIRIFTQGAIIMSFKPFDGTCGFMVQLYAENTEVYLAFKPFQNTVAVERVVQCNTCL